MLHDIREPFDSIRRRQWHPTPLLLPGKSHGRRSLVGCSAWGRWGSDMTEGLHFHFSLSCIGGGNGNPLQCSCLENPRDRGAWWAAVSGVAQSRTWLKRLSSSSSSWFHLWLLDLTSHLANDEYKMNSKMFLLRSCWGKIWPAYMMNALRPGTSTGIIFKKWFSQP